MLRDEPRTEPLDLRTMTPDWYARETRLAHMLPYVSLVDDQTVRTRVNELFRCIRLEGINSYTTDDAYLDKVTALLRASSHSSGQNSAITPTRYPRPSNRISTPSVRTASQARLTGAGARNSRPAGCATRR